MSQHRTISHHKWPGWGQQSCSRCPRKVEFYWSWTWCFSRRYRLHQVRVSRWSCTVSFRSTTEISTKSYSIETILESSGPCSWVGCCWKTRYRSRSSWKIRWIMQHFHSNDRMLSKCLCSLLLLYIGYATVVFIWLVFVMFFIHISCIFVHLLYCYCVDYVLRSIIMVFQFCDISKPHPRKIEHGEFVLEIEQDSVRNTRESLAVQCRRVNVR